MVRKTNSSKYIRIYGMTLGHAADKIGISPYKAFMLHAKGKLKKLLTIKKCECCGSILKNGA